MEENAHAHRIPRRSRGCRPGHDHGAYRLPDFAIFLHEHQLGAVAINGVILADDQQRVDDQTQAYA